MSHRNNQAFPPATPASLPQDFFRTNSGALPDGVNDVTESIKRNGRVGLNTDALTTLDVNGSFSNGHRFTNASANTFTDADVVLSISSLAGATATAVLPNASLFPRRYVTVKTAMDNLATVVTVSSAGGSIESPYDGTSSGLKTLSNTTVKSATWQSDGVNWQLVSESSNLTNAGLAETAETLSNIDTFPVVDVSNGATAEQKSFLSRVDRFVNEPMRYLEVGSEAPAGILPATFLVNGRAEALDAFQDSDGNWTSPYTLPIPVYEGQTLIYRHLATLTSVVNVLNSDMIAPLVFNVPNTGGAEWVAINGKWALRTNVTAIEEIVTVSGVTLPIVFPVTILPGTPVFLPAQPSDASKTYEITNGSTVVYARWNGSQYISSPAPSLVTVTDNATGSTTINAGVGQVQDVIRTGSELVAFTPNSTSLDEYFVATQTVGARNVKFSRIEIAAIPAGTAPFTILASSALTISAELLSAANTPSLLTLPNGNFVGQKVIISNVNGATASISIANTDTTTSIVLNNSQTYTAVWNRFRWVREDQNSNVIASPFNVSTTTTPSNTFTGNASRTGNTRFGDNSAPNSTVDVVGSFGTRTSEISTATYIASSVDHTVFLNAATVQAVTLMAASVVNGREYIFVNNGNVSKTLSQPYTRFDGTTSLIIPPQSSVTLQSNGAIWKQTGDGEAQVRAARTSAYASAIANTTVIFGEFEFRYNTNGLNGNLELRSSTAATVAFHSYAFEQFPFTPAPSGYIHQAAIVANINTGAFQAVPAGGLGTREHIFYTITTATNEYYLRFADFNGTNIHMLVEKML